MSRLFPSSMATRLVQPEQWPNLQASELACPGLMPLQTSTLALVANTAVVYPWFCPLPMAIKSANLVLVTGVAATTGKMALYEWNHLTRTLGAVVSESSAAFNTTTAEQGVISDTSLAATLQPGWYAWAVVDSGAVTIRQVEGVERMVGGNLNVNTTNLEAVIRYTFDGTGVIAGAFAASPTVTAVESNSNFRALQAVLSDFNLNPAV